MKFHVWQRVRKVREKNRTDPAYSPELHGDVPPPIGATGTVTGFVGNGRILVLFDDFRSKHSTGEYGYYPYMLEPLRDDDTRALGSWEAIRKLTGYVPGEAVRS